MLYIAYTVWNYRLTLSGPCCNWYLPDDDDDDEGTHSPGRFRGSRLHCPPQSCQSTAMGRDCATDSAQCCHLWLLPAELTVWPPGYYMTHPVLRVYYVPVRTLTNDSRQVGLHSSSLTPHTDIISNFHSPLTALCVCVCVCVRERACVGWTSARSFISCRTKCFNRFKCSAEDETLILWKGDWFYYFLTLMELTV